ncbi:hypothetical protein BG004_001012 [Podila humilis]|nr:hypothetical protein BG004_001012 [Podila humilis]
MLQHNFQSTKAIERNLAPLQLLRLLQLTYESEEDKVFLSLQTYCTVAEPFALAQLLSHAMLSNGEFYPPMASDPGAGWMNSALDYQRELIKKGEIVKQIWKIAKSRGEDIEHQVIQMVVAAMMKAREQEKNPEESKEADSDQHLSTIHKHNIYYMLHCGPLAGLELPLYDTESVINALARMRDGLHCESYENQLLIIVNLLDRFIMWLDSIDSEDSPEELKERVPELLVYTLDTMIKYLDGRWLKTQRKEPVRLLNNLNVSLLDINRGREVDQYVSTSLTGAQRYVDSKHTTRGRSLRERQTPSKVGRTMVEQEFEISDLIARCLEGHNTAVMEQVVRRFVLHIGMRVDTAMVSASTPAAKVVQQRDKILLTMMSENPVYKRIMSSVMEADQRSAALCLSLIQGMLRCSVAHWTTCKSASPGAYPKELKDTIWMSQMAAQTGLIPEPINQASALFPLIDSRDVGMILEQCYYVLLVRNMDILQQSASGTSRSSNAKTQNSMVQSVAGGPELALIRRMIVKHATRAFHLMPLFVVSNDMYIANEAEAQVELEEHGAKIKAEEES